MRDSTSELAERLQREVGLSKRASQKLAPKLETVMNRPFREKLPPERASITHKFNIGPNEGYITVGMFPDGRPAEVLLKFSKEGSTLAGFADGLASLISLSLQYGLPLKAIVDKLVNTRFEPSGITSNANVRFVSSILDYIGRWLGSRFISADYLKLGYAFDPEPDAATPSTPVRPGARGPRKRTRPQIPETDQPATNPDETVKHPRQE